MLAGLRMASQMMSSVSESWAATGYRVSADQPRLLVPCFSVAFVPPWVSRFPTQRKESPAWVGALECRKRRRLTRDYRILAAQLHRYRVYSRFSAFVRSRLQKHFGSLDSANAKRFPLFFGPDCGLLKILVSAVQFRPCPLCHFVTMAIVREPPHRRGFFVGARMVGRDIATHRAPGCCAGFCTESTAGDS